jgi:hypothetical protein
MISRAAVAPGTIKDLNEVAVLGEAAESGEAVELVSELPSALVWEWPWLSL